MVLRPGKDARLRAGHLWVYRTEIARLDGAPQDGEAVLVRAASGRPLGMGLLNTRSVIAVRLLATEEREIDERFFRDRLETAVSLRARLRPPATAASARRLVYSEGDYLPGLIVDRYGDVLVIQTLTLGMDRRKELLVRLLIEMVQPRGIYARNDPAVRRLEGLPRETGWLAGGGPAQVDIEEDESRFWVDVAQGQKTGFFLDQRENRTRVADLASGARVLDCFAYTGPGASGPSGVAPFPRPASRSRKPRWPSRRRTRRGTPAATGAAGFERTPSMDCGGWRRPAPRSTWRSSIPRPS